MTATRPPTLAELDPGERERRFARLQTRMPEVWRAMRLNQEGESVVVVPSVTVDRVNQSSGSLTQAYEERFLFYRGLGDFTLPVTLTAAAGVKPPSGCTSSERCSSTNGGGDVNLFFLVGRSVV